ncbi:MAG: hypothetical protein C4534_02530 [Gaiellales bacterium]|nr:MAG: hypothetical protein C4534_02530 [Gaiellales bacterium]
MAAIFVLGLAAGVLYRPFLVPWLLASALFLVNFAFSLIFLAAMSRVKASAAAGIAVVSFVVRFGLLGAGLLAVALALPQHFLVTAVCFLTVYTIFFGIEIAIGLRGRNNMVQQTVNGGGA